MIVDFIKALIVGIAASIPIGPIAILVIQKTISKGFKNGFVTSLGSTVVDTIFAVIAVFALAYVQEVIQHNYIPIFIGGGIVVIALGLSMAFSNPFRKSKPEDGSTDPSDEPVADNSVSVKDFASAILMGITNPGAIAVMLALMAFFGIGEDQKDWSVIPAILGIACGSALYWLGVTFLLDKCRKRFKMNTVIWINRITGGIVVILGIGTLVEGIIKAVAA